MATDDDWVSWDASSGREVKIETLLRRSNGVEAELAIAGDRTARSSWWKKLLVFGGLGDFSLFFLDTRLKKVTDSTFKASAFRALWVFEWLVPVAVGPGCTILPSTLQRATHVQPRCGPTTPYLSSVSESCDGGR